MREVTFLLSYFWSCKSTIKKEVTFGILRLGDADRVCFANRSIPRWRRFIKSISADCIDKISPSVLIRLFIFRNEGILPAFSSGRRWRGLPRRMRCYYECIAKVNSITLCSHTDMHPKSNREVRRSLTWHSSESESARGRFEPLTVAKL